MGLLSALELHERGVAVSVLDAGAECPSASWAGGGILSPLPPWQYSAPMHALTRDAARDYQYWAGQIVALGGPDPELRQGGMLVLEAATEQAGQWARRHGVRLEMVAAGTLFPWLGDQPALYLPAVASLRNPRLLKGLAMLLTARGIPLHRQRVMALEATSDGVRVRLAGAELHAGRVLVAAGAWSESLLPGLALGTFPAKGQMLLLRPREPMPAPVLLGPAGYLIPRRDGLVLAGSTVEPAQWDGRPTAEARQRLLTMAIALWPALVEAELLAQWSGVRPGLRRELPLIGAVPGSHGRVWLNSGHYRNGLVCAPASARLLAALMCGETPGIDPAPYSVSSSSPSSP